MDHELTEMPSLAGLVSFLVQLFLSWPQHLFSATACAATAACPLVTSIHIDNVILQNWYIFLFCKFYKNSIKYPIFFYLLSLYRTPVVRNNTKNPKVKVRN